MSLRAPMRATRAAVMIVAAGFWLATAPGSDAGVRSSTELQAYRVGGTSAAGLITYMRTRPFPGDRGAAVANIRPYYTLSIDTTNSDAVCTVRDIDLAIRFVMTLPEAKTPGSFSAGTGSAWNGFVDFARRHEETHRSIYLQCANEFAGKALQLTASSCSTLRARIDAMFAAEKPACDRRQLAFDRVQYRKVFGLSLFAMAKYAGRKAHAPSRFAPSSAMAAPSR